MAYGTVANVAALTRVYTTAGTYDAASNPTATAVQNWLNQFSGVVDVALAQNGFTVPITQADALLSVSGMVEAVTADMCHAANSSGRFFSERALNAGVSPMMVIRKELNAWVMENAAGFEKLGVTREVAAGLGSFSVAASRQD